MWSCSSVLLRVPALSLCAAVQDGRVTTSSCPPAKQVFVHMDQVRVGVQESQVKLFRVFSSHFVRSKLLVRYQSVPRPPTRRASDLYVRVCTRVRGACICRCLWL